MIELGTQIDVSRNLFMGAIIQPVTRRAKRARYRQHSDAFKRAAVVVGRHGFLGHNGFLILLDRLLGRFDNTGIDHLAAARHVAMPGQLAVDRLEHGLAGAGLDQAFLEGPDRDAVRNLAAAAQANKTLEAEAVE
jgi:hypothetical protein